MCRVLEVAPSGYYDWLKQPMLNRSQDDARLLRLIRASFVASHGIYGAPRVFLDLREAGETCSKHRVARLAEQALEPRQVAPRMASTTAMASGSAAVKVGGIPRFYRCPLDRIDCLRHAGLRRG